MATTIYNSKGEKTGTLDLPAELFGLPWNGDLVHQVTVSMQSNARFGTADTKGRGEVRGGGRKPWQQKGTGRARHGSSRSPIWRGGGVTHGPTSEKNYTKKISKKMKTKAFLIVLSQKAKDNEVVLVDSFKTDAKTKQAHNFLAALEKKGGVAKISWASGRRALVAVPENDTKLVKSFRNLPSAKLAETRNLNPLDLLQYKYLVMIDPTKSIIALKSRLKSEAASK